MTANWYALRSKPRKEEVVWRQLKSKDITVFYPRIKVNPVNPRSRKIRPYFPGYLFVQVALDETGMSKFQWMPHSLGLVSFGGEPAQVPEHLIYEIKKKVEKIAAAGGEKLQGLEPGDKIRIQGGPFSGYRAIFNEHIPGKERVRVLLDLLNDRGMLVELQAGYVERLKKKS